jgi:hypothetical protein
MLGRLKIHRNQARRPSAYRKPDDPEPRAPTWKDDLLLAGAGMAALIIGLILAELMSRQ